VVVDASVGGESIPTWWKRLIIERKIVRNLNVSLSFTLDKNEKVKYYMRVKTHKSILEEMQDGIIHIYV